MVLVTGSVFAADGTPDDGVWYAMAGTDSKSLWVAKEYGARLGLATDSHGHAARAVNSEDLLSPSARFSGGSHDDVPSPRLLEGLPRNLRAFVYFVDGDPSAPNAAQRPRLVVVDENRAHPKLSEYWKSVACHYCVPGSTLKTVGCCMIDR